MTPSDLTRQADDRGRSVPEWIGATPDTPIPPRVKLRVFDRYGGRCYLSGRKIMPGDKWECDHRIAIINGGENRESNLAPAIKDKHREKTARDVAEKAHVDRLRKNHLGIKERKRGSLSHPTLKRTMSGKVVPR